MRLIYIPFFIGQVGVTTSTDGSVVEFSPATREARVRFPVSALLQFLINVIYCDLNHRSYSPCNPGKIPLNADVSVGLVMQG